MKKLIYYIAMSILCILPYSCSLDEEARSEMEKKNYMTNAKEAQDVLLGVYRTTVEDAAYGYHLSFLFNMGTDKHGKYFIKVSTEQTIFWNVSVEK